MRIGAVALLAALLLAPASAAACELPSVETAEAIAYPDRMVFRGVLDPKGKAVEFWFEYGLTPAYGGETDKVKTGWIGASTVQGFLMTADTSAPIHYRLRARNECGDASGAGQIYMAPPTAIPVLEAPETEHVLAVDRPFGIPRGVSARRACHGRMTGTLLISGAPTRFRLRLGWTRTRLAVRDGNVVRPRLRRRQCRYQGRVEFPAAWLQGERNVTVAVQFHGNAQLGSSRAEWKVPSTVIRRSNQ